MTYPQPRNSEFGFFHFFTKYTGERQLYFETSKDGVTWTDDKLLVAIPEIEGEKKFNACMLSLKECDKDKPCPLHEVIYPSKSKLIKNLENKTVHELSQDVKSGNSFLPL